MFRLTDPYYGVFAFIVLIFACFLQSCDEDECESLDVKCDGTLLLICNDDGEWEFVADCTEYIPDDWTCCEVNGEVSCYHIEECRDVK